MKALAALMLAAMLPAAAVPDLAPWRRQDAIIIPDPYGANEFHFDQAFADPKIRAVILKAASGLEIDPALRDRARDAKTRGIPFGIYLLGLSPSPSRPRVDALSQADLLVDLGRETGAAMLALDIEGLTPSDISIADAARVITRIHERTGRYPVLYMNGAVAGEIARGYGAESVFAQTLLWIAGTRPFAGNRVWPDYALWQFGAEWDCPDAVLRNTKRRRVSRYIACRPYRRYPVAGSQYDLDVNVLNGGEERFVALFGVRPRPGPLLGEAGE